MERVEIVIVEQCELDHLGQMSGGEGLGTHASFDTGNDDIVIPIPKKAARLIAPMMFKRLKVSLVLEEVS